MLEFVSHTNVQEGHLMQKKLLIMKWPRKSTLWGWEPALLCSHLALTQRPMYSGHGGRSGGSAWAQHMHEWSDDHCWANIVASVTLPGGPPMSLGTGWLHQQYNLIMMGWGHRDSTSLCVDLFYIFRMLLPAALDMYLVIWEQIAWWSHVKCPLIIQVGREPL